MTTLLSEQSSPRLPKPDRYTAFLERLAAEHEARRKEQIRQRRIAWVIGLCWLVVFLVIGVAFYWEFL